MRRPVECVSGPINNFVFAGKSRSLATCLALGHFQIVTQSSASWITIVYILLLLKASTSYWDSLENTELKSCNCACGGGLQYLHRGPANSRRRKKRDDGAWEYNWATLSLKDKNTGIWSSRFEGWTQDWRPCSIIIMMMMIIIIIIIGKVKLFLCVTY
jgi:hypothetical protein